MPVAPLAGYVAAAGDRLVRPQRGAHAGTHLAAHAATGEKM